MGRISFVEQLPYIEDFHGILRLVRADTKDLLLPGIQRQPSRAGEGIHERNRFLAQVVDSRSLDFPQNIEFPAAVHAHCERDLRVLEVLEEALGDPGLDIPKCSHLAMLMPATM